MHIGQAQSPPAPTRLAESTNSDRLDGKTPDKRNALRGEQAQADNPEDQRHLQTLKNRDRAIKAHELAHQAVGGRYVTRGARFDYEKGTDGRQYAVSGDVQIDSSAVPGDPKTTLAKAQAVHRAALAPVNPSTTDRQVAAQAAVMIQQARIEMAVRTSEPDNNPGSRFDSFA